MIQKTANTFSLMDADDISAFSYTSVFDQWTNDLWTF